jgi:glucose 1-dehydrogenase
MDRVILLTFNFVLIWLASVSGINSESAPEFDQKVVIVTGSSSGIGRATVIEFAKRGAQVVVTGRNVTRIGLVVRECNRVSPTGLQALGVAADITVDSQVQGLIDTVIRYYGRIDVLVNNAGIHRQTSISTPNLLELYDLVLDTNLRGTLSVTKSAVPHLIQTKGVIVITASISGYQPAFQRIAYAASKSGLHLLTKNLALELGPKGVRVNSVSPGAVNTTITTTAGLSPQEVMAYFERAVNGSPLHKIGHPQNVAEAILFLASNRASFITGTDLTVDGGYLLSPNGVV